jgi:hypothetical protein
MTHLSLTTSLVAAAISVLAILPATAQENIRGATTGPTTAPGYDHPDQYAHLKTVKPADNLYPVIPHPDQDKQAAEKLAALATKTGKKPNFLVFLLDDVGWWDPGFNGGGIAVGQPTPTMDDIAAKGLILTSAYSTPSCTPSRATIHTGQTPLHHGLLRPPMYDEPGGLDGAITLPAILKKLGYVTQGVGKWHMGENKGSLPQNVGYDNYHGFLGVSDEYTEWRDMYFNPEIALSPDRFAIIFNTLISIAGAPGAKLAEYLPKDRYVDGVDQSSFFIADDGQSARRARIYTMNQYLSAVRVDEFKYAITAELEEASSRRASPEASADPS